MFVYTHLHRVRYRECDPMGVVYHTHYLDYFEASRTEGLRELGIAYKTLEDEGIRMPVIDLAVQYKRSAQYDDLLEIKTVFEGVPSTRIRIDYEVRRQGEPDLLVAGHVTLCFFDAARNRPVVAPDRIRRLFEALPST